MGIKIKKLILITKIFCINYVFGSDVVFEKPLLSKVHESINLTDEQRINLFAHCQAISSYAQMNKNWQYMKTPQDFQTNSKSWKAASISVSGHGSICFLSWDYEKEPCLTKAVASALENHTTAECLTAVTIFKQNLILRILGEEQAKKLIDTLQARFSDNPAAFHQNLGYYFLKEVSEDCNVVQFIHFVNIPQYHFFKPYGNAQNHNLIKLLDGRFIGFDPDYFTQPRTYSEIEEHLYHEFISPQDVLPSKTKAHQRFCTQLEESGGLNYFKEVRTKRQKTTKYYTLDIQKIMDFIATD